MNFGRRSTLGGWLFAIEGEPQWIIVTPNFSQRYLERSYPISFSTKEDCKEMLQALRIWSPIRYQTSGIARSY
jgi:hypothetical protein